MFCNILFFSKCSVCEFWPNPNKLSVKSEDNIKASFFFKQLQAKQTNEPIKAQEVINLSLFKFNILFIILNLIKL